MNPSKKTLDNELDDRWRRKGHSHIVDKYEPVVCPVCQGYGQILSEDNVVFTCERCGGIGEI